MRGEEASDKSSLSVEMSTARSRKAKGAEEPTAAVAFEEDVRAGIVEDQPAETGQFEGNERSQGDGK